MIGSSSYPTAEQIEAGIRWAHQARNRAMADMARRLWTKVSHILHLPAATKPA
jgi:hypothetical protein